jgi:hypothetical protein
MSAAMLLRPLICGALLGTGLMWLPTPSHAETSSYTSTISEVDACNQAQYRMPDRAVLQGFRLRTQQDKDGVRFACTVAWSSKAKAQPTNRPILFPSPVPIPLLGSGWL